MRYAIHTPRAAAGFTLLELMTVMAIIGILAAIAYPSYVNYTRTAKRTDATGSMTFMAQQLERCYSQNFSYVGCVQVPVGVSASTGGYYNVTLAVPTASTYTLTAVPNGPPQSGDTDCASFVIASGGAQSATNASGADNTGTCWRTK